MSQAVDTTKQARWQSPSRELPDDDQHVEWIDPGGWENRGTYQYGTWCPSDGRCTHYIPMLWRPYVEPPSHSPVRESAPCLKCGGEAVRLTMAPASQPSLPDAENGEHVAEAHRESMGRPDKTIAKLSADVSAALATYETAMADAWRSLGKLPPSARADTVAVPRPDAFTRVPLEELPDWAAKLRKHWSPDIRIEDLPKEFWEAVAEIADLSERIDEGES